jgi:hypothetical protein
MNATRMKRESVRITQRLDQVFGCPCRDLLHTGLIIFNDVNGGFFRNAQ